VLVFNLMSIPGEESTWKKETLGLTGRSTTRDAERDGVPVEQKGVEEGGVRKQRKGGGGEILSCDPYPNTNTRGGRMGVLDLQKYRQHSRVDQKKILSKGGEGKKTRKKVFLGPNIIPRGGGMAGKEAQKERYQISKGRFPG